MKEQAQAAWVVHKFGGTSVANAQRYQAAASIIHSEPGARKAVVVSAMSGVTDQLFALVDQASRQDATYKNTLEECGRRHLAAIQEVLGGAYATFGETFARALANDLKEISVVLETVWRDRRSSEQVYDRISGFGEVWSAQVLCAYFLSERHACRWLDARKVLVVTHGEAGPIIDWAASQAKLDAWLATEPSSLIVITGYVASTPEGVATTLKRNGSDYSAAIFASLLNAEGLTIWTDVDGVLSADPRRVPEAVLLDEMSYKEAMELAYFGAKVLHPQTMTPAQGKNIPIWIRNTFRPQAKGTKIHQPRAETPVDESRPVKGLATVDHVALLNVEGNGMIGVPGVAGRLFGALKEVGISVSMISQASSEHSISFVVPEAQGALAKETVEKAFAPEIRQAQIQSVELVGGCSILSAVGDNMVRVPGVAAKFFRSLAKAGISVRAIAQGSSERNISIVIDRAQATRALRAAHSGFYLSAQTLSIGLIGPGLIGSEFVRQVQSQREWLLSQFHIDLRIRGVANSKKMLLSDRINLEGWKEQLEREGVPLDLDTFTRHVQAEHLPHAAIIDCTSNEHVAGRYAAWLDQGIHIVTPNKKANSGQLSSYREIKAISRRRNSHYLYEATVGAGLPVINTLRDLIQTGDRIQRIEGILSGTLSYIFNTFSATQAFSAVVLDAQRKGFTEPDPRDDLSGTDVARKLIILAREIGLDLELADIRVKSLVPEALKAVPMASEFLAKLPEYDAGMAKLQTEAQAEGQVLRYVGVLEAGGQASVELKRYPLSHPFARLSATDNIIAFQTTRYSKQPLIVQGPGAGPEVTAAGVFADLLRLSAYLGAPQ